MKSYRYLINFGILFLLIILWACGSKQITTTMVAKTNAMAYDSLLAKKFGADDYGMKRYVMAFLKKGPNRDIPKAKAAELQNAHLANIGKLAEAGKLVLAGPFFDEGELRGIYIFNVATIAEAEALTKSDPAIKAGSLVMELKEWYGSAAVVGINEVHKKLQKKSVME